VGTLGAEALNSDILERGRGEMADCYGFIQKKKSKSTLMFNLGIK